ncbi:MAG: FHA domain-containing protein [Anaerolineales bacterium]
MITCPACHHQELEGELFCSECGARLSGPWVEPPPTATFDSARLREISKTSTPATSVLSELRAGQVALFIAGAAIPVVLEGHQEYLLGREGHEQLVPDVNLNLYGGREQGVSRIHASLRVDRRQLLLMDLGSTNGTRLNGTPLTAHEPVRLESGDEIRLGKLMIKIHFNL